MWHLWHVMRSHDHLLTVQKCKNTWTESHGAHQWGAAAIAIAAALLLPVPPSPPLLLQMLLLLLLLLLLLMLLLLQQLPLLLPPPFPLLSLPLGLLQLQLRHCFCCCHCCCHAWVLCLTPLGMGLGSPKGGEDKEISVYFGISSWRCTCLSPKPSNSYSPLSLPISNLKPFKSRPKCTPRTY